jgi:hypothetical protein
MLNPENRGQSKFPQYDAMSTEELGIFLNTTAQELETDETRWEELAYAIKLYGARMQEVCPPPRTAKESFADFAANHPEAIAAISAKAQYSSPKNSRRIWRRVASVAAVVAISFSLITAASYATGAPLWSAVIEWTQDAFQFIWQEENHQEIIPGDPTLLMEKYGVTVGGVPNWVPDGYVFAKYYDYAEQPLLDAISVSYQREDGWLIKFKATSYDPDIHSYYVQSGNARIYRTNGIQYYIYPNGDRWSAVWMEDGCECSLHGKFTKRQLKNTLKAMHKEGEALG